MLIIIDYGISLTANLSYVIVIDILIWHTIRWVNLLIRRLDESLRIIVQMRSLLERLSHTRCSRSILSRWAFQRLREEELLRLLIEHFLLFFRLECQSGEVSKNWVADQVVLDYHLVH